VVHPVHTEAVANIKSRDELLLFLFLGTGLRAGIDWDRASPWRRAAGVAATLLACLSKETAVVQPALLLLAWHLTGKGVRRSLGPVLAHGGAVAASLGMRALVLDRMTFGGKLDVIDNTLAAAGGPGERLATATAILGRYLGLVAWPHPLAWDYSFARIPVVGWNDAGALASLGAHGLLAVAAALGIRRRRAAGFGLAFYALTMLLVSNVVVLIGATMGERFLFVPTFGLAVAAADVMGRASAAAWWRAAGALPALLLGVLLAAGAGATVVRNRAWKDNATLFQADIAVCGGSARARFALASEHRLAGERLPPGPRRDELLLLSEQGNLEALRIHPGYTQAWYNLGVTYDAMKDPTRAAAAYREVLARDPRHKEALNNSGVILFPQGKLAEAEAFFRRALEVDPAYADALGNVGACHHSRGELVEAMAMYEKALAVDPGNARMRRGIDDARAALAARGEPAAP
jgi:hypothetical protein